MNNLILIADGRAQVRQGDVLLIPIDTVPDDEIGELLDEGHHGRIVLAHGEATGHAHALYPALDIEGGLPVPAHPPRLYALAHPRRYSILPCDLLRVTARTVVRHEEHPGISIPAGDWLRIIQHEGDEIAEQRRVAD